MKLWN